MTTPLGRTNAGLIVRGLRLFDAAIYACALAWSLGPAPAASGVEIALLALVFLLHLQLLGYFQLYESHRMEGASALARQVLSAQVIGFAAAAGAFWTVGASERLSEVARFSAAATITLIAVRLSIYGALRIGRRRGYDVRNVCVIGGWAAAEDAAARFARRPEWGLRVTAVGEGPADRRRFLDFSSREPLADSLEELLSREIVDEILIRVKAEEMPTEGLTVKFCEQYGVLGRLLVDAPAEAARVEAGADGSVAFAVGDRRSEVDLQTKRLVDILGSLTALMLLWPLLLAIAALVKLSSPGPALFRQRRIGLHGREFSIYKFRTMVDGADQMLPALAHRSVTKGPVFKDPSDWRVTPLGRILRRYSLDELPQLLNVLRGDMSLVGPRPLPVSEARAVPGKFRKRFSVPPGLTCLWQVSGRSDIDFASWMKLDVEYVDSWSLWLDAKLILRTFPVVLSGRGAY